MTNRGHSGASALARAMPAAIIIVLIAVLLERFTGSLKFQAVAITGMALTMAISARNFGFREWYLAALSVALTIAAFLFAEAPVAAVIRGLDQAAFLMAFIYLLTMLHETAATSPSVAACGAYLTRQPPGRRYGALFWGSNVMSVLFNLGAVSLLTPLVQRGLKERNLEPALRDISEHRQINALLRGFALNVVWSPTALAPLAILELIDGVDRQRWTALGLALTAILFFAGWAEDRIIARRLLAGRTAASEAPVFPGRAMAGFFAVVVWLFVLIWGISAATGESIAAGLMLACPILAFGWLWAQRRAPLAAATDLKAMITGRLPRVAPVAATLAFSGYMGRVAAELAPSAELAEGLNLYTTPDWIVLSALPLVLAVMSFFGVSPIMLAVFFGSLFGALEVLPTDATLLALAISCGWTMAMFLSPFATIVMLLAQQTERRGIVLAMGRNWAYALVSMVIMSGFFWAMTGGA